MQQNIRFYYTTETRHGRKAASLEARLLLPLKTLAYGVPCHVFCDYFQMSWQMAQESCAYFKFAVAKCYHKEYLRAPTSRDLDAILKLHKTVHNVDGMFGSLDCTLTVWKNCPKAWQGSYIG